MHRQTRIFFADACSVHIWISVVSSVYTSSIRSKNVNDTKLLIDC